jgi:tetratricopeptide (TPR) repeat protein
MKMKAPSLKRAPARLAAGFLFALPLFLTAAPDSQAQQAGGTPGKPIRYFTISGQVTLPNGHPASKAVVRLTTRAGVPREVFTNDAGRFEFPGMEEGTYVLDAKSMSEPEMASDAVETDTSRTATGTLTVNLSLRESSKPTSGGYKPGVISVEDKEQKIPKDAKKAFSQGLGFKEKNEPDKALENFSRAIELYPDYYQALAERGDLFVSRRKLDEAAADFAQALKANAHYAPALRGSGYCKLEKGKFEEAARDFEQSIAADPTNASTHLLLGVADLQLDRRDAAKAELLKALSFNPPPLRAHIHLANLYAKEHLYQEAADELQKYLDDEPVIQDKANLEAIEAEWRARAAKQH